MSSVLPVSHSSDPCMLSSDGSLSRPTCNMLNCQVWHRITFAFYFSGITVWNVVDSRSNLFGLWIIRIMAVINLIWLYIDAFPWIYTHMLWKSQTQGQQSILKYYFKWTYKSLGSEIFFKEINTFIQQGCNRSKGTEIHFILKYIKM